MGNAKYTETKDRYLHEFRPTVTLDFRSFPPLVLNTWSIVKILKFAIKNSWFLFSVLFLFGGAHNPCIRYWVGWYLIYFSDPNKRVIGTSQNSGVDDSETFRTGRRLLLYDTGKQISEESLNVIQNENSVPVNSSNLQNKKSLLSYLKGFFKRPGEDSNNSRPLFQDALRKNISDNEVSEPKSNRTEKWVGISYFPRQARL